MASTNRMVPLGHYHYPIFGTDIGGFARRLGSQLFFVEAPSNGEVREGDPVPNGVKIWPANELAKNEENFSLAEY